MPVGLARETTEPSFCTVCLALVTPTDNGARVEIASAGHPLPLVVRRAGDVAEVGRPGSLLGVVAPIDVVEDAVALGPGDALVLFTDGITERHHGGRFFEDTLASELTRGAGLSAELLARDVEDAALSFAETEPDDDMAVLVLSVPAVTSDDDPSVPRAPAVGTDEAMIG